MAQDLDKYRDRYILAVKASMAEKGIETYKDIAPLIGITNLTLSAIMKGRQYPTVQHGIDLCKKYGYSANWLFLGKGDRFITSQATLDQILKAVQK